MFDRHHEEAIEDAKRLVEIVEVAPRSWLVRLPIVNSAVFETDAGLVVVDTGWRPADPRSSRPSAPSATPPIRTIIYTR